MNSRQKKVRKQVNYNDDYKMSVDSYKKIAGKAALGIRGVFGLADSDGNVIMESEIDMYKNAVIVKESSGSLLFSVNITAEYMEKIPNLCLKVQKVVRDTIKAMTDISVSSVSIRVAGIGFPVKRQQKKRSKK